MDPGLRDLQGLENSPNLAPEHDSRRFPMAHQPADTTGHTHSNDKAGLLMVLFSLALFFAMTVVGHYVFVAGAAHHDTPPAASHAPH